MKRTRQTNAGKMQRLRQALYDAQRARGAVVGRLSQANRRVIDALLIGDAAAAMKAREVEHDAQVERAVLSNLIERLQTELDRLGGRPKTPDLRWAGKRAPGLLRAAAAALAQPTVMR
jgi:hypothetical protein